MTQPSMGSFLAALRRERGLTQRQLANQLGVSDKTVSRWERGETAPELGLIPVLAEFYGITCDELLRGQRQPISEPSPAPAPVAPTDPAPAARRLARLLGNVMATHRIHCFLSLAIAVIGLVVGMGCEAARHYEWGLTAAAVLALAALTHQLVYTMRAFAAIHPAALEGLPLQPDQLPTLARRLFRSAVWACVGVGGLFALTATWIALDPWETAILGPIWCALVVIGVWLIAAAIRGMLRRRGWWG